ncbi:MAG: 3-phosphoshikimate 1-carboxyvinyltransferase [Clostridia bacterium]|nr:3-phosphoshikimate 1-carboxyvinyltransferase [Clostridia bacterium]MBR3552540.1 3-phosphoshikimate 1-carboxyvinyltransferase [Clostridia bacterium]
MTVTLTNAPLSWTVDAIASKSAAHRMLICAALADGPSVLSLNATSEDIHATLRCLCALGATITADGDCLTVTPPAQYPEEADFDCGESGSTLRFLVPIAAALGIKASFTGRGRLPQRPMQPLLDALRSHGVAVADGVPLRISGKLRPGVFTVPGNISSQFITGLLLALPLCGGESLLRVQGSLESRPYVDLTMQALSRFGVMIPEKANSFDIPAARYRHGNFIVEGDWSNAAFWLCAGVAVRGLDMTSVQGDRRVLDCLRAFGATVDAADGAVRADCGGLHGCEINAADIPDLVPVLAVLAAAATGRTRIVGAARLRLKESDRIAATAAMLTALGGTVQETDDGLLIDGRPTLAGGTVDGAGDHRIVMAAAVAAQRCAGPVTICGAEAVNKSYPSFFTDYQKCGGQVHVL